MLLNHLTENHSKFFKFACKYTKGDASKAEDLLHNVVISILQSESTNEVKSPDAYLSQAIIYNFFNLKRVDKKYVLGKNDLDLDFKDLIYSVGAFDSFKALEIDDSFEINFSDAKLLSQVLHYAKKTLPKVQLKTLMDSLTQDEIFSDRDGKNPDTNKANRRHAITKLKAHFVPK